MSSMPFRHRGTLGKAFSPFYRGTRAVGGGANRSSSKVDDRTSFFLTSLPGGEAKRGSNSSSLDTGCFGRVAVKTSSTSTS